MSDFHLVRQGGKVRDPHPGMKIPKIMASGKIVDLAALRPEDVNAWDVAHALAHLNRYTGACPRPWSVLRHTMLCVALAEHESRLVGEPLDDATRLAILLHDAPEAYVGDMLSWLKRTPEMEPFRNLENGVARVAREAFGLVGVRFASVRWGLVERVDGQAYDLEMRTFWPGVETAWPVEDRSTLDFDPFSFAACNPFSLVCALKVAYDQATGQSWTDKPPLFAKPESLKGLP